MFQCKNIYKSYSTKQILSDINISVKSGARAAIIGASGAGKSSLLRIIGTVDAPTSGQLTIDRQAIDFTKNKQLKSIKSAIGLVTQTHNLLYKRTALENILLALEVQNNKTANTIAYAQYLLDKVGLRAQQASYPDQLSGGQKQRITIARALVTKPKILLCDEFTSALDPNTAAQVLKLLLTLQQEFKFTLLVITHDLYVAKTVAEQLYVLDNGKVVEAGDCQEILLTPKSKAAIKLTEPKEK